MIKFEDERRRVVKRLIEDGWVSIGGGEHENFVKPGVMMIQVPRHRVLSQGVSRTIHRRAGWIASTQKGDEE